MRNLKQLQAAIDKVIATQEGVNEAVQSILLDSTRHALAHRDVTPFSRLVNGMKGADREAIILWSITFAPVKFAKDGAVSLNQGKYKETVYNDDDYTQLPIWTDYTKSTEDIMRKLDGLTRVESLIKSLTNPKDNVQVVNGEIKSFLEDAVMKFKATLPVGNVVESESTAPATIQ